MSDRRFAGIPVTGRGGHTLALCLAVTVLALSVFAVSHVHGVSDPHTHHSLLDFLIFAQSHTGFLIAVAVWILFVLAAFGRIWSDAHPASPRRIEYLLHSRAPPSLP